MSSCLAPTQATLEITTDALCEDLDDTHIVVGALQDLANEPPTATTGACASDGRIGSLVITPQKDKDGRFAFEVFVGVTTASRDCADQGYEGCIVARRALNFIPHESLTLPIELELECLDVPCEATQTCRRGQCVAATLDEPLSCVDPAGCSAEEPGGTGGAEASSGGASSGGEPGSGGASSGGEPGSGGASSGGEPGSGGVPSGGASSGGSAAGGEPGSGGASSGGASSGGSGGQSGTGGALPVGAAHLAIVTTADDVADAPIGDLSALAADPGTDGLVSLREAILAANLTTNEVTSDRIEFAIPGSGPHVIVVEEPGLPPITDAVEIDGWTQNASKHEVALDGKLVLSNAGLTLQAGSEGSWITGLVIYGFAGAGIYAVDDGSHTIRSCIVGLEADGKTPNGNAIGIQLHNSPGNAIGGSLDSNPPEANIVSGNVGQGFMLTGDRTSGNVIRGNIVGLDLDGTSAAGNGTIGIEIKDSADFNVVGSAALALRNVISANGTHGVRIMGRSGGAHDNIVQGNFIGLDADASSNATLGNNQSGVRILMDAQRTLVGGGAAGEGNRIAHNGASGVRIGDGTPLPVGTSVLGNAIFNNGELGIDLFDLSPDLVTPNDAGDIDEGTNGTQNYPEMLGASYGAGSVNVDYSLDTIAGTYRIEFFASSAPDDVCAVNPASPPDCLVGPGGVHYHGEGASLVHVAEVTVAGIGSEAFQTSFQVLQGQYVTATCTVVLSPGVFGATSEFSRAISTTFP